MKKKKEDNDYTFLIGVGIAIFFIFAIGAHVLNSVDKEKILCASVNGTVYLTSFEDQHEPSCFLSNGSIILQSDIELVGLS